MLRAAFVLTLGLAPMQAWALSCMPWHVENAFQEAFQSDIPYFIVSGTLEFAQEDFPVTDWSKQDEVPPETRLSARLSGDLIGTYGHRGPFSNDVTFAVTCAGPWCPSAVSGEHVLAFVQTTQDGYVLELGACGGMVFARPDADMLERVQTCLDGGPCAPAAQY